MIPQPTPRGTNMANLSERLRENGTVEAMARAIERDRCRAYGWTDEQFETWWSRDPDFVAKVNEWGHFRGTRREKCIHEVEVSLTVLSPILDRLTVEGLAGVADAAVNDWWADYSAGRVDSGESSVYVARAIIAYINTGEEPQALAALSDTPSGREISEVETHRADAVAPASKGGAE